MDRMIYISGGVTNEPHFERKFTRAEQFLKEKGYENIINPIKINQALPDFPNLPWSTYMAINLEALKSCTKIYMLTNWKKSRGAQLEHDTAKSLDMEIIYQTEEEAIETAKQMFYELEFLQASSDKEGDIVYIGHKGNKIEFLKGLRTYYCTFQFSNVEIHMAIHRQLEELGWLDE